jgi:hypothetical protein
MARQLLYSDLVLVLVLQGSEFGMYEEPRLDILMGEALKLHKLNLILPRSNYCIFRDLQMSRPLNRPLNRPSGDPCVRHVPVISFVPGGDFHPSTTSILHKMCVSSFNHASTCTRHRVSLHVPECRSRTLALTPPQRTGIRRSGLEIMMHSLRFKSALPPAQWIVRSALYTCSRPSASAMCGNNDIL